MPTYKLSYFNVTGLGEPIRLLLHYAGVDFEDRRISFEEWPNIKPTMPVGQMPVLEIDGKPYFQSKAIARYLAKQYKLYGSNDIEAMEIDTAIETMDDARVAVSLYYWQEDPHVKQHLQDAASKKVPVLLNKLESMVKENGGYLVGGKLSWADLHYTAYSTYLSNALKSDVNKDYPELKKLVQKVEALPRIKAYIEKRPKTMI